VKHIDIKEKISCINNYKRFEYEDKVIYIDPEYPNWIVLNHVGDEFLQRICSSDEEIVFKTDSVQEILKYKQFSQLIPSYNHEDYKGRAAYLKLSHLDEVWFHITDNCNLKCSHCLFSCSPYKKSSLSIEDIKITAEDAYKKGARIFYLTGGEPFVHPDIKEIILFFMEAFEDAKLVIMTNGVLIPSYEEFLSTMPEERIFFQVSVDGKKDSHEKIRGIGSYKKLLRGLEILSNKGFQNTLSMAVHVGNISDMEYIIDLAARYNFFSVHYMWLILKGEAGEKDFVSPEVIFDHLVSAFNYAKNKNIEIDNIKNIEALVFSPPGTRYDLGSAGWRSIAAGPDRKFYPTAAMVGDKDMVCGTMDDGVVEVWNNSDLLDLIRKSTVRESEYFFKSPFKFITGGGDFDLSYYDGGKFVGEDPYLPLYEKLILWLISENSINKQLAASPYPEIFMKMGDRIVSCHSDGMGVSLTHSNCVLTFSNTRKVVGDFYAGADKSGNEDIVNPVCYAEEEISHIPSNGRFKSYGCGSPVLDSSIKEGETIVDLGCGAGVECFIAAKKTGKNGKVYGIDMLDHMLSKAHEIYDNVALNLGYRNIEFKKGFLENIPIDDDTADLIVSNCVINLSEDKRKTLSEIFRILKAGGRLVVSDVVTDSISPPYIQNDEQLQGECIAGAMVQTDLLYLLESLGFKQIQIKKRFFYRKVKGHDFYSLTYEAYKPAFKKMVDVIYPGPYAGVVTDDGDILLRGEKYSIAEPLRREQNNPDILILDDQGNAANIEAKNSCCCFTPEEDTSDHGKLIDLDQQISNFKYSKDCMVCGAKLLYSPSDTLKKCFYCSKEVYSSSECENGHFVCDSCHGDDAFLFVRQLLMNTDEKDMISLFNKIRQHPLFNLHGPEHHYTIPGVIVAVYRNMGGKAGEKEIETALQRGKTIPGGVCAFWGGCGAALGVGAGFGVILESNPLKGKERQMVQQVVGEIINEISKFKAPRCCQRESWTSFAMASSLSEKYLGIKLYADGDMKCTQYHNNTECIKGACPFYV